MGQIAFTHVEKGLLLHYSWLITRTREAGSEFGHRYAFAEPAALLWNGYTHPAARGRGLHQASIRQRARYVATHQLAPNIVTGVRSDNGPSRHNIEKLGFEYVGSAWMKRRFGKSELWLTGPFLESRDD
jgi:RimJ/RimL family protein N-acetyltransferase